ncbi:12784_t:CDS:1, partial [Acaulospora colombiana]
SLVAGPHFCSSIHPLHVYPQPFEKHQMVESEFVGFPTVGQYRVLQFIPYALEAVALFLFTIVISSVDASTVYGQQVISTKHEAPVIVTSFHVGLGLLDATSHN